MKILSLITILAISLSTTGCLFSKAQLAALAAATTTTSSDRFLYVASGACYTPGSTQAGSNTITRFNLSKTNPQPEVIYDFNADNLGEIPGGITDLGDSMLVAVQAVEPSPGVVQDKLLYKINKTTHIKTIIYNNSTTFPNAVADPLRAAFVSAIDGSIMVAKSIGVEKLNASTMARLANYSGNTTNPFGNVVSGACGLTAAASLINSMFETASGKVIMTHAGATPNNKVLVMPSTGINASTDCTQSIQPAATANANVPYVAGGLPTAAIVHSKSGKLLVATSAASATSAANGVLIYNYNDTTGAITSPAAVYPATPGKTATTVAYFDPTNLYQPTAMVEDTATGNVFVANFGLNTNTSMGNIRQYSVDSVNSEFTDLGIYVPENLYSRCVSSMFVGK